MNKIVPDLNRLLGFKLAGHTNAGAVVLGPKVGKINTDTGGGPDALDRGPDNIGTVQGPSH